LEALDFNLVVELWNKAIAGEATLEYIAEWRIRKMEIINQIRTQKLFLESLEHRFAMGYSIDPIYDG